MCNLGLGIMCGIAGFIGHFDPSLLEAMNLEQAHRGHDDAGVWYDSQLRVGLSHRRLAIIDLSKSGHQPMHDKNFRATITFNGEIYNYRENRKLLVNKGYQFQGNSDTEVLLNLYLEYGVNLLEKLNGIYAFAIWDQVSNQLFIARDEFGIKPLYYSQTKKGFIFASEMKAVLQEPSINCDISTDALWNHIIYLWNPAPETMIQSIKKLEPGNALIVKDGKIVKKWIYYSYPFERSQCDFSYNSDELCFKSVREGVRNAVHRQMVADVPIGAFLSGGLDSSSVVAFARECTSERLQCFTIDLSHTDNFTNDLPYARKVAKHLNVDLHEISVGSDITNNLDRMIYHLDEPQADPAPLNALMIAELAKQKGINVLLSGAGGDDIFAGYRRHFALQQEKYWQWAPHIIRCGLRRVSEYFPQQTTWGRRIGRAFANADKCVDDRIVGYFHWINKDIGYSLLHPDVVSKLSDTRIEPLMQTLSKLPKNLSSLQKMLCLEIKHFLCDHNLNYTDKTGMAVGVEVRVPLLDKDLVQLSFSLPDHVKQRGRQGKWVFKKAMEGILPNDIIYRPKSGFGAPLRHWLNNEWQDIVNDTLSTASIDNRGLFHKPSVSNLLEKNRQGQIDASYSIFSLVCMELWCRQFIDRKIK